MYEITYDLSGYRIDYDEKDDFHRCITYVKNDMVINYYQYTKESYDMLVNTENVETTTVTLNGKEAVYFCDNHMYNHIIWDNGEYIIYLSSNINKNTLIEITNSVRKVE